LLHTKNFDPFLSPSSLFLSHAKWDDVAATWYQRKRLAEDEEDTYKLQN